jgi:WD40 repeat protein
MAVAEAHPSAEELTAFTLGTLDDAAQAFIEDHVATCTSCQERAATAPGDSFVELVRSVHARPAALADTLTEAPQAHTPAPRLREAVAVAPSLAVPADSDPANDLNAIPPELARHERYRVVRLLGEGGMGSVYEAEQVVMQRRVALKVIRCAGTASPAALERFRREVRAAARLSHPNIVAAYDAETAGGVLFLVMEYVEGITLAWLVKERGPLPIDETCEYVRQAALGLQHAHERGLVHRDIKPDNLTRCSDGTVKILDFGLAALTAERGGGLTEANVVMGTPEYMAPEQAEDSHGADIRADLYSLGCTLYYLLTGKPPYPAPTPLLKVLAHRDRPVPSLRRARPDVPPGLAAVVERLLAKKPADRYQTPRELAAALRPFTRPMAEPRRKRWSLFVAAAVAALFAGIVLTGAVVYRIQTDKGELVITTESDDVEVVVSKRGEVVKIIDKKSGKHVTLNSGDYELALKDGQEGLRLSPERMTVKRGETALATVERVPKQVAERVGEIRRFVGHTEGAWGVAFSPDGRYALSGDGDGTVRLWEVATGREVRRFSGPNRRLEGVAFSPDGRQALTASYRDGGTVQLWDVETGKEIRELKGHTGDVWRVTFSPDGRRALSGGHDSVRLWDLESGKELRRFARGCGVAFSPDGRQALAGGDPLVRLWDLETGAGLRELRGHTEQVTSVVFLPGGRQALSCSHDRTLRLWDLDSGQEIRCYSGHMGLVHNVAITRDGKFGLSSSSDKTVRLWDLETGKELHCFTGHTEIVVGLAISPDGKFALSGSPDGTMRLWRLPDLPRVKEKP